MSFLFNFLNATIWECTPFDVDCGGMREQLVEDGAKTSLQTLMEDKCCPFRKDLSGESECLGIRRFWETISSRSAPRSRPFRIMFMTPNCRTVRGNLAAVNDTNYQHLLLGGLEEDQIASVRARSDVIAKLGSRYVSKWRYRNLGTVFANLSHK